MRYSRGQSVLILISATLAILSWLAGSPPQNAIGFVLFGTGALVMMALPIITRARRADSENDADDRVAFDDIEIRRFLPDGTCESITWEELHHITIVTTDAGPWLDDVLWLFANADHSRGCLISNNAPGFDTLLARLQALPGFDNEAVVRAMGSTSEAEFVAWRRAATTQPAPLAVTDRTSP